MRHIQRMNFRLALMFSLIAFALKIVQETKAQDTNVNRVVNCHGRCGEDSRLPCSCHPKCFVFKNCCEFILTSCPHIEISAFELYGHLVDAQVVCGEKGIAMISSCPYTYRKRRSAPATGRLEDIQNLNDISKATDSKKYKSGLNTKSIRASGENLHTSEIMQKDGFGGQLGKGKDGADTGSFRTKRDAEKPNVIIKALRNAPVYDSSTGFMYQNASVLYCNGGKKESLVPWITKFGLTKLDNVTDINDFERYLTKTTPVYLPPPSLTRSQYGFQCYQPQRLISGCDPEIAIKYPELPLYCDSFTSYVTTGKGRDQKRFRNRHCFYCNSQPEENFEPVFRIPLVLDNSLAGLALTMSLNAENRINLEIEDTSNRGEIQWTESSCQLNIDPNTDLEISSESYESRCEVKICDLQLQVRPDGQCKALHNTYIAFDLEELEYPLISQEQENQVLQFLRCGLNHYLDVEVLEINEPLIIRNEWNKTLYVANISTFLLELDSLSVADAGIADALTAFLNLLKTFKEYRKPGPKSFCRSGVDRNTSLPLRGLFNATTAHSNIFRSIDYSPFWKPNTNGKVINNDTTTVCLGSSPATVNSVEQLICIDEPFYEHDLNRILEICHSTCFSIFHGNNSKEWTTPLAVKGNQSLVPFNWGNSVISSGPLTIFILGIVAATTFCLMAPH